MQASLQELSPTKEPQQPVESRKRLYSDSAVVGDDFADMPVIDLEVYLKAADCADQEKLPEAVRIECQKVAECFHKFGILLIRDPRVNPQDNEDYVDMMEDYFEKTGDMFYAGKDCSKDIKPECHYQVGATPDFIEKARDHSEKLKALNLSREN